LSTCSFAVEAMQRTNENISPKVLNLVLRQIGSLSEQKLDGVRMVPNNDDPADIQALIEGPEQTPYAGGMYRVKICLGAEFPVQPPRAFFLTRIFHPNIAPNGDVCVNTLKRDWDPQNWSIGHILQIIRCLLIVPFPESALNEEAGRLFMENYEEYASHAAMMNRVHATPIAADAPMRDASNGSIDDDVDLKRQRQKQVQKTKKILKRL
jgi:ubiquitin-conjugating enzyme E2 S